MVRVVRLPAGSRSPTGSTPESRSQRPVSPRRHSQAPNELEPSLLANALPSPHRPHPIDERPVSSRETVIRENDCRTYGVPGILIAVGMIGAGLPAAVVISLSSAWAWAELFRWPHCLNLSVRQAPRFYAVYLLEVLPAAIIAIVAQDFVGVVINAMIVNVLVLAIPLAFLIRLSGDRASLGDLAASRRSSAVLWTIMIGLLALGLARPIGVVARAL